MRRSALALPAIAGFRTTPAQVLRVLAEWRDRRRSRAALARLGPHLLQDIGLSGTAATTESHRPFWQP